MPQTYSKLRKKALAMPYKKRADLAVDLITSLDKPSQEEVDRGGGELARNSEAQQSSNPMR